MSIRISKPYGFHEKGQRNNNEDNLFPPLDGADESDNLFMVCDGVGGSEFGEKASRIAVRTVQKFMDRNVLDVSREEDIVQAVLAAQEVIRNEQTQMPEARGMGTTLTLLHFHSKGATVAHVGDSRVYQFRGNQIIWQSKDHSLMRDLIASGELTEAEAAVHPRRKVITRAIQGGDISAKPDVETRTDVRAGDLFLLCSDGVLDVFTDDELQKIIGGPDTLTEKRDALLAKARNSPDNATAWLIPVHSVQFAAPLPKADLIETPTWQMPPSPRPVFAKPAASQPSFFSRTMLLGAVSAVGVAVLAIALMTFSPKEPKKTEPKPTVETPIKQQHQPFQPAQNPEPRERERIAPTPTPSKPELVPTRESSSKSEKRSIPFDEMTKTPSGSKNDGKGGTSKFNLTEIKTASEKIKTPVKKPTPEVSSETNEEKPARQIVPADLPVLPKTETEKGKINEAPAKPVEKAQQKPDEQKAEKEGGGHPLFELK